MKFKRTINQHEVSPRKSMGQNFLQDNEICAWIVEQALPYQTDQLIEIGPGLGALTEHLIATQRPLWLIEKDDEIAAIQAQKIEDLTHVRLLHEDATQTDYRGWHALGHVTLVGNLPYSVGGEILKHYLEVDSPLQRVVVMLQKEVCQRITAKVGDPGYGGLSLLIQKDWDAVYLRTIPPEVFIPKPKVDSGVIVLTPRDPRTLPIFDKKLFTKIVKMGFIQRRKQLKNLLPPAPMSWDELCSRINCKVSVRAEELSLQQWVEITRIHQGKQEDLGQKPTELFDVVDENNQVVEQRLRSEVHHLGLRHRAVHIFVENKRGEVYLQKRSHLKDVAPLKWDSSAAGHLNVGESYEHAALRETEEEIGIILEKVVKLAELPASAETDQEFIELYIGYTQEKPRVAPEEIHCGAWFTKEQIQNWVEKRPQDFAKGFVTCWKASGFMI
jgi:16S rRNA (adenine1518-N6/adenine1519-N6)-dimethyltransferase